MSPRSRTTHFPRPLVVALGAALSLAACGDDPGAPEADGIDAGVDACVPEVVTTTEHFELPARPAVDVLFVVDDSGSMVDEQVALAEGLRTAAGAFTGTKVDYRFAVSTTDLRNPSGQGRLRRSPGVLGPNAQGGPRLPDCTDRVVPDSGDPPLFDFGPVVGNLDDDGVPLSATELGHRLECLTSAGSMGDGFEKGLEAMRLALSCDGPNAALFAPCCAPSAEAGGTTRYDPTCTVEPAFLRPEAALVVVFLSDERDCSDPASNAAASSRAICRGGPGNPDANGVPAGFAAPGACPSADRAACYAAECGTQTPDACYAARCIIDRGDNNNCAWFPDALTPVDEYVQFLTDLKGGDRHRVGVYAWVGPRGLVEMADGEAVEATFTPGQVADACLFEGPNGEVNPNASLLSPECCPDGMCTGGDALTCTSEAGSAYSGTRYLALAEAFSGGAAACAAFGNCEMICGLDPSMRLQQMADSVPTLLVGGVCLSAAPACETVEGHLCVTEAEHTEPANYARGLEVTVSCEGDACETPTAPQVLEADQVVLERAPSCPGGLLLRTLSSLPLGGRVEVSYPTTPAGACDVSEGG